MQAHAHNAQNITMPTEDPLLFSAGIRLPLSSVDMKKGETPGGGPLRFPFIFFCSAPRAARLLLNAVPLGTSMGHEVRDSSCQLLVHVIVRLRWSWPFCAFVSLL
ncbi:hypothetical protein TcCL_NonESM05317 [Trypanosoma cruzi]|nr:hypothetical protein TcCL_NonESM05317 [Trypanosoma cruzi]